MKRDYFIAGTRPEIIKIAPILKNMKKREYCFVHTGQHSELAEEMLSVFKLKPDIRLELMKKSQTPMSFLLECLSALDKKLKKENIKRIWVQGDTSSALAGALFGYLNAIEVVHVEAGLRTYNLSSPYPEEGFRQCIDMLSTIKFAPTVGSFENLVTESPTGLIAVTGNTIVDSVEMLKSKIKKKRPIKEPYVLVTIHRRESFGEKMKVIFEVVKSISESIKVVLPAHPNPNVRLALEEAELDYVEPMDYVTFLNYLYHCEYILTDSGGVQEEAASFGKKVVICRTNTERPEVIDAGFGVLVEPTNRSDMLMKIMPFLMQTSSKKKSPFGDGNAAKTMLLMIKHYEEKTLLDNSDV